MEFKSLRKFIDLRIRLLELKRKVFRGGYSSILSSELPILKGCTVKEVDVSDRGTRIVFRRPRNSVPKERTVFFENL